MKISLCVIALALLASQAIATEPRHKLRAVDDGKEDSDIEHTRIREHENADEDAFTASLSQSRLEEDRDVPLSKYMDSELAHEAQRDLNKAHISEEDEFDQVTDMDDEEDSEVSSIRQYLDHEDEAEREHATELDANGLEEEETQEDQVQSKEDNDMAIEELQDHEVEHETLFEQSTHKKIEQSEQAQDDEPLNEELVESQLEDDADELKAEDLDVVQSTLQELEDTVKNLEGLQ